jgi:LacI family transcriptional regulator
MRKTPTVSDIARAAKVSTSTVSRVLTGSTPVNPEKRAAVLEAIDRLNFRPNLTARSLVRGRSMTIGVMTQSLLSQFYGEITVGIEEALSGSGYHPLFASGNWHVAEERTAVSTLLERKVDGLIVLAGQLPEDELRDLADKVPLVVVGRRIAGLQGQCIHVDDFASSYRAVRHLIDLNHRQIVHVTGDLAHADAVERLRGYTQALSDAGLAYDERLVVEGNFIEQGGLLALEALLVRGVPFTAIFAANDQLAYGLRLGLYRHGLRVPEDVSLVGFDDLLNSAYTTPPLTTVRQSMLTQGQRAAQAILRMLGGELPDLQPLKAELVLRESTRVLRQ